MGIGGRQRSVNLSGHYAQLMRESQARWDKEPKMPKYTAYFDLDTKKKYGTQTWERADGTRVDCTHVYDTRVWHSVAQQDMRYLGFVVKYVGSSDRRMQHVKDGLLEVPYGYRDPSEPVQMITPKDSPFAQFLGANAAPTGATAVDDEDTRL